MTSQFQAPNPIKQPTGPCSSVSGHPLPIGVVEAEPWKPWRSGRNDATLAKMISPDIIFGKSQFEGAIKLNGDLTQRVLLVGLSALQAFGHTNDCVTRNSS